MPKKKIPGFVYLWIGVLVVAIAVIARKVGAEPPVPRDPNAAPPKPAPPKKGPPAKDAGAPAAPPAPPASASASASPDGGGGGSGGGGDDDETVAALKALVAKVKEEPKTIYNEDPVDYAVTKGDGGVPLHEGRFKSPFAHPKFGTPTQVKVGILVANVREYDVQKGTFGADFFLTLTSDKPMPTMDLIFTNGKVDQKEVMADKPTWKMYRYLGTFSAPTDLHDYPFDTQELSIEVEDDDNGVDQVQLVADEDHTNLDVGFEVPSWETSYIEARVTNHNFPDRFEHDDLYYARYVFKLGIKRYGTSAIFTVFVPAFVIVLISLSGLWITRDELEVRSNATTPMLAAAVLFHFALMQALPATAYLTRADKLMLSVYVILGLHMLAALFWFFFDEEHTDTIFKWSRRIGVPLTFIVLALGVFA